MSLINDVLKQARQTPPRNAPSMLPPLQPAPEKHHSHTAVWLVPAILVFIIFAVIFFVGYASSHRTVKTIVTAPVDPANTAPADPSTTIVPVAAAPPEPTPVVELPRLQGIFWSPTAPSAILAGKTIHPGDQFKEYKVKEINKQNVILIGPDKKEIKIGL